MENIPPLENKRKLIKSLVILTIVLSLYFAVKFLAEIRAYQSMGSTGSNVITLTGHGEVPATPDIASISFTVESSQSSQSLSSDEVNKKATQILAFLKSSGIADIDVKTENYSSYPKYSRPTPCPIYNIVQDGNTTPCNPSDAKIVGYTVSESMTVKVRKVDDASKIIDGINKIGVTNMNGPNFTIDNPDALQAEARKAAIDDAQTKAKVLAKDLGVHLGHISSFNESGAYPMPVMYAAKAMSADSVASVPAQIPTGQNTITSDVSITYDIR